MAEKSNWENNYLYIAHNKCGIVKIGVTKNNPHERVDSFCEKYDKKFELVTYFNIKRIDRLDVETFFHEVLNSQFLNINYLAKNLDSINEEHSKIVSQKLNGYTELFVENKNIIKNTLLFLHLIDVIDLKEYDINQINTIDDYKLGDVKVFKKKHPQIIIEEKKKSSLIKPLTNNKENLMLKNSARFFTKIGMDNLKHLGVEITSENINFKLLGHNLKLTNFLYAKFPAKTMAQIVKTKLYKNVNFLSLVEYTKNLRLENSRVSTQWVSKDKPTNYNKLIEEQPKKYKYQKNKVVSQKEVGVNGETDKKTIAPENKDGKNFKSNKYNYNGAKKQVSKTPYNSLDRPAQKFKKPAPTATTLEFTEEQKAQWIKSRANITPKM